MYVSATGTAVPARRYTKRDCWVAFVGSAWYERLEPRSHAIARAVHVPPRRINEIVLGKRGVSADTAVRLAATLGTSERFWLGLQADYDLEEAHRALGAAVSRIERIAA